MFTPIEGFLVTFNILGFELVGSWRCFGPPLFVALPLLSVLACFVFLLSFAPLVIVLLFFSFGVLEGASLHCCLECEDLLLQVIRFGPLAIPDFVLVVGLTTQHQCVCCEFERPIIVALLHPVDVFHKGHVGSGFVSLE